MLHRTTDSTIGNSTISNNETFGADGTDSGEPDPVLRGVDQAADYVAGICFKTGPPALLGVELEWTVHHVTDPTRPLDPALLARALQPHTPSTVDPESPHLPLPRGGVLSIEPGGQVEISTPPRASLAELLAATGADVDHLTGLLARAGLRPGETGADAHRPPRRLLSTPRYDAMATSFAADGPDGRTMMCSTAAVQVCVDAGQPDRVGARWAALHALGPVLLALFANSSRYAGHGTGWASARMRAWLSMDQARTGPVPAGDDPARDWARYALRAPVMCVRRTGAPWRCPPRTSFADWINGALGDPPTRADLDYHLTTLFPPVRPRGYLEVRYLDQQPRREWHVPVAVLAALLLDDASIDRVRDLCAPVAGRWLPAARHGLARPEIARAARAVADLAGRLLPRTGLPARTCDDVNELVGRRLAGRTESAR
jgi:glutamate--cysteine ligase